MGKDYKGDDLRKLPMGAGQRRPVSD